MANNKEDPPANPPANPPTSSAGEDDEQRRVTRFRVPRPYFVRHTYPNYRPVPQTFSIVPSDLRRPNGRRPQVLSWFGRMARDASANPDRFPFQYYRPVRPTSSIVPRALRPPLDRRPQDAVPDIPDIRDRKIKTEDTEIPEGSLASGIELRSEREIKTEDTEIPEGSLASGIELRTERGYSGNEASCEGSDADYQYGSPPKARDHQSSSDDTPQKGNPTRVNESSQPVLRCPMTTGAVTELPVPGELTRCITNFAPTFPICGEITLTANPTTSASVSSETWTQDMQELKRQRKLEGGRESARRVKLRKAVAELGGLTDSGDVLSFLTMENASLREEMERLREENEILLALNASMKVKLEEIPRETEDQQQNPEFNEKGADDQHQNPDSNEKRADDQHQNADSNEKRADDQQQNPDSNEKRVDDKHQNPESDEKRGGQS